MAKRAQIGAPSNGRTTAQKPLRVERGQVVGEVDEVGGQAAADHREGDLRRDASTSAATAPGIAGSVRSRLAPAGTRSAPVSAWKAVVPVHVEFTEEHDALRRVVREFAEGEIAPHAEAWDRDHHFPVDVVRGMGDLGLFGIPFPEEYGGGGGDLTMLCIAIEELARVDHSMAITLEAGVGLGANPIHRFGTEAQKQTWLPDLCAGRTLGGFGLTEPEAGSDAGGTRTTATLDEAAGEWVINGEKAFITNSGTDITAFVTVTARTGPGRDQHDHRAVRHRRASRCSPPTGRWAGTRPTPTASPSPTPACRRPTCSASGAAASPSSSRSSTRGASPSRRWRWAACRPASSTAPGTRRTATPSGSRSAPTRAWPSRSPTWR